MPIQFPNYQRISFDEANPELVRNQRNMDMNQQNQMFPEKLRQAQLMNAIKQIQAKYAEPTAQQELLKAQQYNQMYIPDIQSQVGLRGAQTNRLNTMTPLEARELGLKNDYYGQNIESEIANRDALTQGYKISNEYAPERLRLANEQLKQRNEFYPDLTRSQIELNRMGGRGMGVGGKEELFFQQLVSKDNPQLGNDPNKIYEASNVLRQGGNQLADGTPLNPMSEAARSSADRITKGTTYAGVAAPLINAVGAEKEIDVLSKYAQKGLEPYGTTYFGMNPDQIMDSFKSDTKSQLKLGKFIASQQLQFEIAQNQNRIAMGQPGITNTQELMDRSMQSINAKYPRLSYAARKEANRYFTEGLKEALNARKKAGVSISKSLGNSEAISNKIGNKDITKLSDDELRAIANG